MSTAIRNPSTAPNTGDLCRGYPHVSHPAITDTFHLKWAEDKATRKSDVQDACPWLIY